MIQIEILDCPDPDYICELSFFLNPLLIGKNIACDVYLPDKDIPNADLILEVQGDKIMAQLESENDYFWVNEKRSKKIKFLKINDVIKIGASSIRIKNFSQEKIVTKRSLLNKNTEEIITERSPLLELIKEMQKDL